MDRSNGKKLKPEARGREDVVRASVKEQENKKMTEAEVESFHLDFGEFPLDASLLGNGPYAEEVASKLVFPADAERFGKTSDALLADHLITGSIMTSQLSCEAARRLLAVESRENKYEEEIGLLAREVLALESKLIDATALSELTKGELNLSRAKVGVLEAARKKDANNLQLKEDRIQELELELKSKLEAAEENEEAVNAAYQHFIKDLAQRGNFFATKYYTQGKISAKIQIKEMAVVDTSEMDLDCDDGDYQSDVGKERGRWGCKKKRSGPSKHSTKRQRKVVEASKEEEKSPVGTDDESDKDDEMELEDEKGVQNQSADEKHSSGYEKENESEEESEEESKKHKLSSYSGEKESVGKQNAMEEPSSGKIEQNEFRRILVRIPYSKGKKTSKGKEKPSEKELRDTICEILKEFDFNTVTVKDVFKRIGKKYKEDLSSKKWSIKLMIAEEFTKLAREKRTKSTEIVGHNRTC